MTEDEAQKKWPILAGKRTGHSKGYIRLFSPSHPNADSDGWVYEHTYVASSILGRGLRKGETTHHIYGDPTDNKRLVICTHAYHRYLHARMQETSEWPQFSRPAIDNRPRCVVCGTPTNYNGATPYCVEHYWQHLRNEDRTCRVMACRAQAGSRSGLCRFHMRYRGNKRRFNPQWDYPK